MQKDKRLKALDDVFVGDDAEAIARMRAGKITPLDVMSYLGRGYDSVMGAPTRSAIQAGMDGQNPISAAASQFGENPDKAPDFGLVGNALADPLLIAGGALKGAKYFNQIGEMGAGVGAKMHQASDGKTFKAALDAAVAKRPMIKDFVSDYSAEDLEKFRTFLAEDGLSGFAIKPDGDLINVFSQAGGRGTKIMREAVSEGPKKLDAYDVNSKLPSLYKKYGFNEIKREANWTPGGPDVVYMKKGVVDQAGDLDNRLLRNALRLKILSGQDLRNGE